MPSSVLPFLQRHCSRVCYPLQKAVAAAEYWILDCWWALRGFRKPSEEDVALVAENVTIMFKSFERQKQAKALVKSIRRFFPGTRIVIADDSREPLEIAGDDVKIIHLPFNSGLSKGLNLALAEIKTPFMVRMDDDELMTRRMNLAKELQFFRLHPEVDLVGMICFDACKPASVKRNMKVYGQFDMSYAPLPLKIAHGTWVDSFHVIFGKVPNCFIAKTEAVRQVGWDDNIRMIDHHDFFYRAAGVIVSAISRRSIMFHNHNYFLKEYNDYRSDWKGDAIYLRRFRYRK